MVKRIDRIILRAADTLNGTPAAYGVTELERLSDGTDRELPMRDVDVSLLGSIAAQFNIGVLQTSTAWQAEKTTLIAERDAAKQELADIYELLGADPKIAEIKKQQAFDKAELEIAEAIKRKNDLVNPKAVEAEATKQ